MRCCVAAIALLLGSLGCGEEFVPERHAVPADVGTRSAPQREACAERNPLRNAYFGDLHVHTAISTDASVYDVTLRPDDAYRYAFGEPVLLPPLDSAGQGTRRVAIDRPLDFAAVTDHAEFFGEQRMCWDPESEGYDTESCQATRSSSGPPDSPEAIQIMTPWPWRKDDRCGADNERCFEASRSSWLETQQAAQAWNDTSARCERTTFVAYEYSSFRMGSNLHRNVVFRNATVPKLPVSYLELQREWELWAQLKSSCIDSGTGCDVMAIPHNSNIGNGRMFIDDYAGASSQEERAARAALRIAMEPIVEVMQHKGDSECRATVPGVVGAADELCNFEKFENGRYNAISDDGDPGECYEGPLSQWVPRFGPSCISRFGYTRYTLTEGLAEEAELGVNPYKFGLMASTDTHNATAGAVEERSYVGHLGKADATPEVRLSRDPGQYGNNYNGPGGLIGVWAPENTRDALFDAMRSKEVFGTSGPRIQPRFFGGFGLDPGLCARGDFVEAAYAQGVPMGGDLAAAPAGQAPRFLVAAARDAGPPGRPGGLLQRIQIIKGWVEDGVPHQEVHDVAGGPNDAGVDMNSCTPRGAGAQSLCQVWQDPDFDPAKRAVYYARVLENPSCRYSQWECIRLPEADRPEHCSSDPAERVIQERAWTSPIWYTPTGA